LSANQTQVGGSHYKDMKIQPVDYIHANGIGFIEGSVIKYVSRHKSKNGKQDLEKAIHFLQLLIEREYPNEITVANLDVEYHGYRLLSMGEVILDGDEVFDGVGWNAVRDSAGMTVEAVDLGDIRRPIKPKEAK
jgi:hypothetical protein